MYIAKRYCSFLPVSEQTVKSVYRSGNLLKGTLTNQGLLGTNGLSGSQHSSFEETALHKFQQLDAEMKLLARGSITKEHVERMIPLWDQAEELDEYCQHLPQYTRTQDFNMIELPQLPYMTTWANDVAKNTELMESLSIPEKKLINSHINTMANETLVCQIAEHVGALDGAKDPNDIICLFKKIVEARSEAATRRGYLSYAHMMMGLSSSFHNPNDVYNLLTNIKDELINHEFRRESLIKPLHERVSEYFTLENCLEGLEIFCWNLFRVKLRLAKPEAEEKFHDSIMRLELLDENSSLIGIIYLDLFSREGGDDIPGAIQLGCSTKANGWKMPFSYLTMNLTQKEKNTHLSYKNASDFFHEFGHVFSQIFMRTDLAGGRLNTPSDLLETPSILMEYFFNDFDFVSLFARHYSSGLVIPRLLVEDCRKENKCRPEYHGQILELSLFDISIHGNIFPNHSWEQVEEKSKVLNTGTSGLASDLSTFYDLISYGSGFYTYLLGNMNANLIYNHNFLGDPLNLSEGMALRKFILAPGAENPPHLMKEYLGEKTYSLDPKLLFSNK